MISSLVNWAKTLQMRVKLLMMMMWCDFVGKGMNKECDQVKRREALELEEFSWLDLPTDMVELILLKLRFEDQAKLACVCKRWRDIIQTLPPIYPVGKIPLLMHIKSRGDAGKGAIIHYYSPLLNKAFQLGFPFDLRGYEILSAKDGTLLMYNQDERQMKMVDPIVGCWRTLRRTTGNISFNGSAIGVHKDSYIIFLIDTSRESQVTVHLYRRRAWTTLDLVHNGNEPFHLSSNPVYFDRRFYCLDSNGDNLGVFDVFKLTWTVYSVEFKCKYDDDCSYYLVEWIDTVMAVQVKNYGSRMHLFLLDREKMVWKETDDLCGRSLFLGSTLSAMSMPTTATKLQNRVFLPHSHQDEPKTVMVAEQVFCSDLFYFRPRSPISSEQKNHAATTICCCNNSGEDPLYLGSTQSQKYCSIWYQPFYLGLTDD